MIRDKKGRSVMPITIKRGGKEKEYKTVAERTAEAHAKYGGRLSILTEIERIVEREDRPREVIIKATVQIASEQSPTLYQTFVDYAHEVEDRENARSVNFTSWLENCSTSAIGRALAAAGFAGHEYASADELQKALEKGAQYASEGQQKTFGAWLKKHYDTEGKDKERVQAALSSAGIVKGEPCTLSAINACMMVMTDTGRDEKQAQPKEGGEREEKKPKPTSKKGGKVTIPESYTPQTDTVAEDNIPF